MRALVTNDDGVASPGIALLAATARATGLDVTVAAPSWDSSGASASLTAVERRGRLLLERHAIDGLDVDAYGVEAAPAFIVRAAVQGAFGAPPEIVLSGVNRGPNTGHAVLHSGTVGAALTAATFGLPALAFSMRVRDVADGAPHWDTAAMVAQAVLDWFVPARRQMVLNVNVPDEPPLGLRGLVRARLARVGAVQTSVTEVGESHVSVDVADVGADAEPGTDAAFLAAGYACYTPLLPVCDAEHVDAADVHAALPGGIPLRGDRPRREGRRAEA